MQPVILSRLKDNSWLICNAGPVMLSCKSSAMNCWLILSGNDSSVELNLDILRAFVSSQDHVNSKTHEKSEREVGGHHEIDVSITT